MLDVLPKYVRGWVDMRANHGAVDASHILLFYLMKSFSPGGAEEKVHLTTTILNPGVCANPRAAQLELLKWKDHLQRSQDLGCSPPDLVLAYRAMEFICSAVSETSEPQLNHRWINLRNSLNLPHVITVDAMLRVAHFAEAELAALILMGGSAQNTGLPLTENQRNRLQQQKDADKRRAAKVAAAAAT